MATWFNLGVGGELAGESGADRTPETGRHGARLPVARATLFDDEGRQLTAMFSTVSRQSALDHIANLGMRVFDSPRLLLYIKEPFAEAEFIPLPGPLETDDCWAHAAIARLKVSGGL